MRIEFGLRSEDPYGRALFYVYTEAGERVAEKLIREGLGKAWERDGQHRELFMGVENGAESGRSGPTYSIVWRFDWSRDRRATR